MMSEKIYDEEFNEFEKDDVKAIARCEECGELIYEDNDDIYISEDGYFFCCLECALRFYGIQKAEDNMMLNNY